MPVDKFERNCDTLYTGINIANLTNSFLRRDGGNTAIGAIHMNSYIIKNMADPLSNQDVNQELCRQKRYCYCWRCCLVI